MAYNQTTITPHTKCESFNVQHKDLHFTVKEEMDNQMAYLDLNLIKKQGQLKLEL
jgi:hypothetical protein